MPEEEILRLRKVGRLGNSENKVYHVFRRVWIYGQVIISLARTGYTLVKSAQSYGWFHWFFDGGVIYSVAIDCLLFLITSQV